MELIVCSSLSQAWKEQPTSIALLSFFPSGNRFLRRGPFLLSNIFAMQSPVYWEGKFINSSQELSAGHSNTHKQKLSPFLLCSHPFPWYGMIPCPWYDTNSMVWYDSIPMVWYHFHITTYIDLNTCNVKGRGVRERGGREGRGERIRDEREGEWGRERIREGVGRGWSNLAKVHPFAITNVCHCSQLKLIGLARYTILSAL